MAKGRKFGSWARSTMARAIRGSDNWLQANSPINPLSTGVKRQLMMHSPGIMGGAMVGGAWGAYEGATDPRSGTFTGAVWGGLTGAATGGALGYGGSYGMRAFRGRKAPVNTPSS